MVTTDEIAIAIQSFFNDKGVRNAEKALLRLNKITSRNIQSFANVREQVEDGFGFAKRSVADVRAVQALRKNIDDVGVTFKRGVFRDPKGQIVSPEAVGASIHRLEQFRMQQKKNAVMNKKLKADAKEFKKTWSPVISGLTDGWKTQGNVIMRSSRALSGFSRVFQMQFLSLMFGGMALQRVMIGIAKSSIATFQDITEGTTAAGQGVAMLQSGFKVLSFAVGEAIANFLLPMIPAIMQIIDVILRWITHNETLTAKLVLWGAAIGTAMFVAGQFVLALGGLAKAASILLAGFGNLARLLGFTGAVKSADAATKSWTTSLKTLGRIAGIAVGALLIWDGVKRVWEGFKEGDIWDVIVGALEGVFGAGLIALTIGGPQAAIVTLAIGTILAFAVIAWKVSKDNLPTAEEIRMGVEEAMTATTFDPSTGVRIPVTGTFDVVAETTTQFGTGLDETIAKMEELGLNTDEFVKKASTSFGDVAVGLTPLGQAFDDLFRQGFGDEELLAFFNSQIVDASNTVQTFEEDLEEMGVTAAQALTQLDPQQIQATKTSIAEFVDAMNALDFTNLQEATSLFDSISQSLLTVKEGEGMGLLGTLNTLISILVGENSVKTALDEVNTKLLMVSETITDKFTSAINNSIAVLQADAEAALDAAAAQERYNRAKQGATGP